MQVISSGIKRIENKKVLFENNTEKEFDVIVFATGYKSVANNWLKVISTPLLICMHTLACRRMREHRRFDARIAVDKERDA